MLPPMLPGLLTTRRIVSKPLVFGGLLLALLVGVILFAPGSNATRQTQGAGIPQTPAKRHRPDFVSGDVMVRFKKNRAFEGPAYLAVPNESLSETGKNQAPLIVSGPQEEIPAQVERFAGSDLVDGLRIARVAQTDTMKAVSALQARDDVLYAEPNYVERLDATPNDPQFSQLYGMTKIGAPQAWDITTGSTNVVVGVIDEGIDISHPDLQANIWTNLNVGSISGISGDLHGYNFRDNTGTIPAEDHATHVAGTIGAVGNNGVGVAGVNWRVRLMSLRFISSDTGSGSDADALKAYSYAKQMRDLWISSGGTKGANIRVLNASYGGGGYSQAVADAINALGQSGILFVAAAGNDAANDDTQPHYPSNYSLPNVISVAATNSIDNLASFSNFGAHTVMVGAPGVDILSTTPNNTYSSFSGTSMATPHVTGAAALLCAANPNLSVNQLRALLSFNGDVIPALQGSTLTGRRLNVFKSLQAMNENDTASPGRVGSFQVASQAGRAVSLSWSASGDDGPSGQASLYDISFVDQTTGAIVPLTTLMPAPPGAAQTVSVNIPYRHTSGTIQLREFDNVGNEGTPATLPINISPFFADPYATALSSPAALSTGGTPLGLTFDDRYLENYSLPFDFPFFGKTYNTLTISTNGNLYFSPPPKRDNGDADDVPSSTADLSKFKMIAGMWDDLDLRTSSRADADVYVVKPNSSAIIFRWQGMPCNDHGSGCTGGDPINFEIELNSNGTIKTRYGAGNTNLNPVVGISGGEPDAYVIDALTSELSPKNLTNASSAIFTLASTNPIDDPTFFVQQQYRDFLNREADAAGLQFYVNILNGCAPSDIQCLKYTRGALSANFFRSPEFQRKGNYVMYLYMVSIGQRPVTAAELSDPTKVDRPHFAEFIADLASISTPNDDPALTDQKKDALAVAWLQRAEIQNKYGSLSNAAFVQTLLNTAGVTISNQSQLISDLNSAAKTRAQVLRVIAESPEVNAKFYKQSFVTMEYFGYLRRDPESCFGSTDPANCGYIFHNSRFQLAADPDFLENTIVRGFIESPEYRQRFGP